MYLIDSDVVIRALRGQTRSTQLVTRLRVDGLAISLITYGEIYEGIYYGLDPAREEQSFRSFLRRVRVLPLNRPIMQRYARLRGQLRRSGMPIGDNDTLIAATALYHGLTVVTGNTRHFGRVPGLSLLPL